MRATRRSLIAGAGLAAGTVLAPEWAVARSLRPRDVGRKFYADGRVMPFAGNTIICHLPQQGEGAEAFGALLDVYRELPLHPFSRKMTALPPSSYHMTVIGGANDKDRRRPLWPDGVALDATMADCNAYLAQRLRGVRLGSDAGPYRMTIDMREAKVGEQPLTMRLVPADEYTQSRLLAARSVLAKAMGIGISTPDAYGFHITLGYAIEWLTPAEDADFRLILRKWKEQLFQRVPVLTFGAPEYCLLDDMFHFARQFYVT